MLCEETLFNHCVKHDAAGAAVLFGDQGSYVENKVLSENCLLTNKNYFSHHGHVRVSDNYINYRNSSSYTNCNSNDVSHVHRIMCGKVKLANTNISHSKQPSYVAFAIFSHSTCNFNNCHFFNITATDYDTFHFHGGENNLTQIAIIGCSITTSLPFFNFINNPPGTINIDSSCFMSNKCSLYFNADYSNTIVLNNCLILYNTPVKVNGNIVFNDSKKIPSNSSKIGCHFKSQESEYFPLRFIASHLTNFLFEMHIIILLDE